MFRTARTAPVFAPLGVEEPPQQTVERIAAPLAALVRLAPGLDGYLAIEKHLLRKQGVFKNEVIRGPVAYRLDEATSNEVDRLHGRLLAALE